MLPASGALLVMMDDGLYRLRPDGTGNAEKVNGLGDPMWFDCPDMLQSTRGALLIGCDGHMHDGHRYRLRADGTGDAEKVKDIEGPPKAFQLRRTNREAETAEELALCLNAIGLHP